MLGAFLTIFFAKNIIIIIYVYLLVSFISHAQFLGMSCGTHSLRASQLPCKAKMQYLPISQVSRYCRLAFQTRVRTSQQTRYVEPMLAYRLRRCPNIRPILSQRIVFAGQALYILNTIFRFRVGAFPHRPLRQLVLTVNSLPGKMDFLFACFNWFTSLHKCISLWNIGWVIRVSVMGDLVQAFSSLVAHKSIIALLYEIMHWIQCVFFSVISKAGNKWKTGFTSQRISDSRHHSTQMRNDFDANVMRRLSKPIKCSVWTKSTSSTNLEHCKEFSWKITTGLHLQYITGSYVLVYSQHYWT